MKMSSSMWYKMLALAIYLIFQAHMPLINGSEQPLVVKRDMQEFGPDVLWRIPFTQLNKSESYGSRTSIVEHIPCNWPTGQQYWSHPTDCRMYVQCTPLGPLERLCTPGTAWSQLLLTCNHEANIDCGGGAAAGGDEEEEEVTPAVEEEFVTEAAETAETEEAGTESSVSEDTDSSVSEVTDSSVSEVTESSVSEVTDSSVSEDTTETAAPFEELWVNSAKCGPKNLLLDQHPAQCNPKGEYPCCNPSTGWCGKSYNHCLCLECTDYRRETVEHETNMKLALTAYSICSRSECPEGFFNSRGSKKCYKIFKDVHRNWFEAMAKCKAEGLTAAKPSDAVAIALRKYILITYGDGEVWLGGRGNGTYLLLQSRELRPSNPLWYPGNPGSFVTTEHCLALPVYEGAFYSHPYKPFGSALCSNTWNTLCEVIME